MWAHSFNKNDVTYIQSMGVRCGLRLATRVRQDKQGVRRRSVDEVWIDGKSNVRSSSQTGERQRTPDIWRRGDEHREEIDPSGSRTGRRPCVR